jgi:hypothetical protein
MENRGHPMRETSASYTPEDMLFIINFQSKPTPLHLFIQLADYQDVADVGLV